MSSFAALLFGASIVYGSDLWITDYVPKDSGKALNESGELGICHGSSTRFVLCKHVCSQQPYGYDSALCMKLATGSIMYLRI